MGNDSPGCAATDLHEIHLARQSSLQVPVGHITVPSGIKLCSPGTFLVANYLIINNGSCQVNFTKLNSATIRYTNSQWFSEEATEASVGEVAVPKTDRGPVRGRFERDCVIVRHVGMALEYLWAGSPCRRPVMTPERNRFEIGWVMVSPRWDDAGMARGCLIFTARGFFYRADACCKRFH